MLLHNMRNVQEASKRNYFCHDRTSKASDSVVSGYYGIWKCELCIQMCIMFWVMLRQSCLTFMLHTQACFPYYAGLSTMKQVSCVNTLQNVCQYYMYNKSYSTGNPK